MISINLFIPAILTALLILSDIFLNPKTHIPSSITKHLSSLWSLQKIIQNNTNLIIRQLTDEHTKDWLFEKHRLAFNLIKNIWTKSAYILLNFAVKRTARLLYLSLMQCILHMLLIEYSKYAFVKSYTAFRKCQPPA